PMLVDGLRRLEYRGYDSAGLATVTGPGRLHVRKRSGRIANLVGHLRERPAPGCLGISHTRWATHGPATDANAHPHLSGDGRDAVYLQDHQLCRISADEWHIYDRERTRVSASVHQIDWEAGDADKGEFEHHMLKEIHEQPRALEAAMRGRLSDAEASAHFGGL